MSDHGTEIALLKTYRLEVLLPVTSEEHLAPCQLALEFLAAWFPDGCTISRAAPPLSTDLRDGFPAWTGRYTDPTTQRREVDAHILFLGHWSGEQTSEAAIIAKLAEIESYVFQLYAEAGRELSIRDVYQVEIFVQLTPSSLALITDGERKIRAAEKDQIPQRVV